MKTLAILGSSGSIGLNALEVIRSFPGKFKVAALSTNSNIELLARQVKEFKPLFVCVGDPVSANKIKGSLGKTKLLIGKDGLALIAAMPQAEEVLLATSGASALIPLLEAVRNGKQIALANKEAMVMAGPIVMEAARRNKAKIIPVDSEQSAIWQCLEGEDNRKVRRIYLTASGGPFRKVSKKAMRTASLGRVLEHPRWKMGRKITVDSATLMNKGLELLEAMFLFDTELENIEILIHPQAIIHSMVEFVDGVILAQLSATDMRIPIQYALTYPDRLPNRLARVDFYRLEELSFERPDYAKFPCLGLAYKAAKKLGTAPCVLNAANEISVDEFLKGRISFSSIPDVIEKVLSRHRGTEKPALRDILEADAWARKMAAEVITSLN